MPQNRATHVPKPPWLRKRLPTGAQIREVEEGLRQRRLHTICEAGCCPNRGECFSRGVATLLVMGASCTRSCTFCAVTHERPGPLDPQEPERVAEEVGALGLRFVVVTSVTRDDLPDGGAAHFAAVTRAIRAGCPGVGVELLIPDFRGSPDALETVLEASPDVLAHNVETVPWLYPAVRPQADYGRSVELIRRAARAPGNGVTKSGLMVGLGEKESDVVGVMEDLRSAGCDMLTIGQYLAPSRDHHPVREYVPPEVFEEYERRAKTLGFLSVASGPFVRSSYMAEHYFKDIPGS